ncbi:VCBS repeat-containing protein [Clostridium sp. MB40-C1]|uniref:VCBS repeat-containing protein n=1 Tax=Clostridium sp. MB40-C1 TaxID=3070996 RepID=UPI0027E1B629|nr:VCBS repeat-containing protein [Clostridium sp. MB40-C1]WMJ80180.1 VCBS repeat-containing protein [Clostridium sp. MB40-C1]
MKNYQSNNTYILDFKVGDVNGDGILDRIYLIGNKESEGAIFEKNIALVIEDGLTNHRLYVPLETNAGYGARLFLGDFTNDRVKDIKISIDSGGSGGLAYYYIYSFKNNVLKLIFDYEDFNQEYQYQVIYRDNYKVDVINKRMKEIYTIDISYRDPEYLSEIYNADGTLKEPLMGWVNPLGALWPVVTNRNSRRNTYDLLAIQRIAGRYNADALGNVQTLLTWDGTKFNPEYGEVTLFGREYIG